MHKIEQCTQLLKIALLVFLTATWSLSTSQHGFLGFQDTGVRDLRFLLDTAFTASAHCGEAANTTRWLLFMVRRSFYELSKTSFMPLRGHTYRLLQGPSRLRRRSGTFSFRVLKYWNRLPAHLVLSPSVSIFKKQLGRQRSEIYPAAPV